MDTEELLKRANEGDMVAQYELAEHYGKLLKQTEDETEIYQYSLDAMLWLKKSAQQGYEPAMEALTELNVRRAPDQAEPPAGGETEPEADDETVAAVTAAVLESTAEVADFGGEGRRDRAGNEAGDSGGEAPEEEGRGGLFTTNTSTALFIMLIISLLLNALLLAFLFRMSRESRSVHPAPTPIPVAEVTPEPTPGPHAHGHAGTHPGADAGAYPRTHAGALLAGPEQISQAGAEAQRG